MRAAIYARVSTYDQNNSLQLVELERSIQQRGWHQFKIYQDTMSGAKAKRPGLDALMEDARRGKFDVVMVWKLDRFGRSLLNCLTALQELEALGVRFIAQTQGIDTDKANPVARLLMNILGSVAEFERELIRERVGAGIAAARARGTRFGRPPKAILQHGKKIRELRAGGMSITKIARTVDVGVGTVYSALQ